MKKKPSDFAVNFYAVTLLLIAILFVIALPFALFFGLFFKKFRVYYLSYVLLWRDEMNRVNRIYKKMRRS